MIFSKLFNKDDEKKKDDTPVNGSDSTQSSDKGNGDMTPQLSDADAHIMNESISSTEQKTSSDTGKQVSIKRQSVKKSKVTKENSARTGKKRVKRIVHTKKPFHSKNRAVTDQVRIYDVLVRPAVTEKAALLSETGTYAFFVRRWATKHTIVDAIEAVYGVRPIRVRIAKKPSKSKRIRVRGREREHTLTESKKKAYVFLKKGDTIKLTQ